MLGRLLADPSTTLARVPAMLGISDAVQRPAALAVSQRAREIGVIYYLSMSKPCDGMDDNGDED